MHHERDRHAGDSGDCGDIALVDLPFGTLRNPEGFDGEAGFYDGGSSRVGAMLVSQDVPAPVSPTRASGVALAVWVDS